MPPPIPAASRCSSHIVRRQFHSLQRASLRESWGWQAPAGMGIAKASQGLRCGLQDGGRVEWVRAFRLTSQAPMRSMHGAGLHHLQAAGRQTSGQTPAHAAACSGGRSPPQGMHPCHRPPGAAELPRHGAPGGFRDLSTHRPRHHSRCYPQLRQEFPRLSRTVSTTSAAGGCLSGHADWNCVNGKTAAPIRLAGQPDGARWV